MDVGGVWYLQPGDLPAPFAYHVELGDNGRALWFGKEARWEQSDDKIRIFHSDETDPAAWFSLPGHETDVLMGELVMGAGEGFEDEDASVARSPITDAVALLRDPGALEVRS